MDVRLDGKVALITGGSLGLGRAMALRFAEAGASIAIVARGKEALENTAKELREITGENKIATYACNVADASEIQLMHSEITKQLGAIDILVDELWQNDLDLKLFAAIRLSRLILPGMQKRKWGRIINVLNTAAKAPAAEGAPTAVSRAAGMALTKVLAGEAAKHNVLVNALLVGLIDSNQHQIKHKNSSSSSSYESFLDDMAVAQNIPMGRVGRPEEFADTACFLASDLASYLSGVAINVDGGRSPVV